MADTGEAVHVALYQALKALSVPVYDGVPQGSALPYVTIDTASWQALNGLVSRGEDGFVYLTVWSESRGQAEVLRIMGEIDDLLDMAELELSTGRIVHLRVDGKSTQRDADNVTFNGTLTLRIMTTH